MKTIKGFVAKNGNEYDIENMSFYKTKEKALREWGTTQKIVPITITFKMQNMGHLPSGAIMRKIIKKAKSLLPNGWGVTILVYQFHKPSIANYISDAERPDMIKMLRETADRLESKQDFSTPESN